VHRRYFSLCQRWLRVEAVLTLVTYIKCICISLGSTCRLTMFEILLRLFTFIYANAHEKKLNFLKFVETPILYLMDPRRARDPRLARADRRQSSSAQPAPTPPPTSSSPQWSENGVSSVLSPAAHQPPQPTPSNPSSFPATESATPPSSSDATSETPQYKPRPLFCVVCASNQASN